MAQGLTPGESVAIVGGGCAGLAAAATLAEHGVAVTLYETSRQLGGRARGLNWKSRRLDNGQHILIGAYRETLHLMRLVGVDLDAALLRLPLQLTQHRQFSLRASSRLPAPLHVLSGLLRAEGLRKRERLAALGLMAAMKLSGFKLAQDEPLEAYLKRHRQPQNVIRWLWEPLCLAALNTPLAQASTQVFLNVLRDSFSGSRADSDLLLPRRDLSALLAEPLADYVRQVGGNIRLGTTVTAIRAEANGYMLACDGESAAYSHVIAAVSPFRLDELVAQLPPLAPSAAQCENYGYQPIYTVYLQYPEQVRLPFPMLGLCGGHAQWVIDRGSLDGQHGLMAVVISAEGPHQQLTQESLAEAVAQELAQAFPDWPQPLWHKVIAEKRATFACTPDLPRPAQRAPLPNFYLAGDYTAGDYPATIEGAVRSGVSCARMILAA